MLEGTDEQEVWELLVHILGPANIPKSGSRFEASLAGAVASFAVKVSTDFQCT